MLSSSSSLVQNLKTSLLFILLAYCLYFLYQINLKSTSTNCNCHATVDQSTCRCRCITSIMSTNSTNITLNLRSIILEESENTWEKFVRKRDENILKYGGVYTRNIREYNNLASVWDVYQPYYTCPFYKERIGRFGDGGKWVCGLDHLAQKPTPCIVYSYGVSSDFSFEQEILTRTNCSVFMYDHTIQPQDVQPLLDLYKGRVQFKALGIGSIKTDKLHTLKNEMDSNGHQFIDIVKMDIEGSEYHVFEQIVQDYPHGLPFGQLQIELHMPGHLSTLVKFWQTVENVGLRAFHTELNHGNYRTKAAYYYTWASEYSFINVKVNNYLINEDFKS